MNGAKVFFLFVACLNFADFVDPHPIPPKLAKRNSNPHEIDSRISITAISAFFFLLERALTSEELAEAMTSIRDFIRRGSNDLSDLRVPALTDISALHLDERPEVARTVAYRMMRIAAEERAEWLRQQQDPLHNGREVHTVAPPIPLPETPDDFDEYPARCVSISFQVI